MICSDKTGTLTQNRMTLVKAFDGEQIVSMESDVSDRTQGIIKLATLCTDGKVTIEADGREKAHRRPDGDRDCRLRAQVRHEQGRSGARLSPYRRTAF